MLTTKEGHKPCALVVLSLESPVQMGVYVEGKLTQAFESSEKASVALAALSAQAIAWCTSYKLNLEAIFYATGPGSFSAMKLTHVFLHTLSVAQNIPLFGALGFVFNAYQPIKAFGKNYYCYKHGQITLCVLEEATTTPMQLPDFLDPKLFAKNPKPLYLLPPV
ncbi:putative glycoprotease family protein [Helicobacter felis]|uniref:Glycoprotease family protein n=1 Tax=Helicobacter felis (strain ATCC 49179 / CCUG 28539 / NCTC 12436 / CS1) TaxID=936155 RepID=E7A9J1_HELFC|nr:putative glycoprotease family protein [Helicobacter felis]CBY82517.1 Putative glycoprotease family protein [Helicobacter felis ATCC 49179]